MEIISLASMNTWLIILIRQNCYFVLWTALYIKCLNLCFGFICSFFFFAVALETREKGTWAIWPMLPTMLCKVLRKARTRLPLRRYSMVSPSWNLLLILSQCTQWSLWSVGWRPWLALPCVYMWALVAIFVVVCSADLCGSLPWTDHCISHHICSLLAQLSFVDHLVWLPILPMRDPDLPTPHRNRCRVSGQESFFSEVSSVWQCWLAVGCRAGSLLYRVAMEPPCCAWYFSRAPTNLWWLQFPSHQLMLSLIIIIIIKTDTIIFSFRLARENSWKMEFICLRQVDRCQQTEHVWAGKCCYIPLQSHWMCCNWNTFGFEWDTT